MTGSKAGNRSSMTGFYVSDSKPSTGNVSKSGTSTQTYRLPDGKVVRQVDRGLFDRAVKAAMSNVKK